MFDLINFSGFNVGPLDLSRVMRLPQFGDEEASFNQCCGSRVELSPYTWCKYEDYQYYPYHTKGIRLIPGKINTEEVKILPEEKLVEWHLNGNTLTFIVLKKKPPRGGAWVPGSTKEGFSGNKYTLTENTNDVSVLFPFFGGMGEYRDYTLDFLLKHYPRLSREHAIEWIKYYSNTFKWLADQPGYQVFIITCDQLESWEKYVRTYKVNVVQEEYDIINHNYAPDPRLNLFLTYKE